MPTEWPKLLRTARASLQVASLLYGPGSGMGAVSDPRLGRSQGRGWVGRARAQARSASSKRRKSIQCGPTLHRSGRLTITTLQEPYGFEPAHARGPISAVNGPVPAQMWITPAANSGSRLPGDAAGSHYVAEVADPWKSTQ